MKKVITLSLIVCLGFAASSCKKRKARKTLIGTWELVEFEGTFENTCNGQDDYLWDFSGDFGTIEFEKKEYEMNFDLDAIAEGDPECYDLDDFSGSGEWKVENHSREIVVLHEYELEIGGKTWTCYFDGPVNEAEKADGEQDAIRLQTSLGGGEDFWMYLTRVE